MRTVLMSGCVVALVAASVPAQAQSLGGLLSAPLHILNGLRGAVRGQIYRGRRAVAPRRAAIMRRGAPVAAAVATTGGAAAAATTGSASTAAPASNTANSVWAGPLFWPNAYDGLFEYAFGTDDGSKFWARGYGDVVEGMFVPSQRFAMDHVVRRARVAEAATDAKPGWISLCGGDEQSSAQTIADRVRDTVKPTDAQRANFYELEEALTRGFDNIKAVCPSGQAATPTERLNLMISRLAAMRQAVLAVSGPLKTFYASLSDEQKAAFDGVGDANARVECTAGPVDWPAQQIARTIRPTRQQYPELERLRQTSLHLATFVGSACPAARPKTVVERLDAVKERLSALRYAALNTGPALNRFYLALNNEQKQRLGAPGRDIRAEVRR